MIFTNDIEELEAHESQEPMMRICGFYIKEQKAETKQKRIKAILAKEEICQQQETL